MEKNQIRHKIWKEITTLHLEEGRNLSRFNKVVFISILFMLIIMAVRSEKEFLPMAMDRTLLIAQILLSIFFVIEWFLRLWASPEDPRFQDKKYPRLHWFMKTSSWFDFLAILPILTFALGGGSIWTAGLRFIRIFIFLRFLRFFQHSRVIYLFSELFRRYWKNLAVSLVILLTLAYMMSIILWFVEHPHNEKFASIPRAFWWASVTITTVGYGDVIPVTILGKFVTSILLLLSMAFIALPGSIMAAGFMDLLREEKERESARTLHNKKKKLQK